MKLHLEVLGPQGGAGGVGGYDGQGPQPILPKLQQ